MKGWHCGPARHVKTRPRWFLLPQVDVADNVDLLRILQEFEESYELKFGKRPKVVRRLVEEVRPLPAEGAGRCGTGLCHYGI